jgi:hypothetical protein
MSDDSPDSSAGWDAIDRALRRVYGDAEPLHYGTLLTYSLGGPDPLDGISVYKNLAPAPHWHFVSYGLSELYDKESANPDVSGFGLELTFRLACNAEAKKPPVWPLNFLQNLARYVLDTGNIFGPGHHLDLNGPIALDQKTAICAAAFALDPRLKSINTPHGRLSFVQVVGLTLDEYAVTGDWDTSRFLKVLAKENPLLVTDLKRRSILDDPEKAEAIRRRIEREGSSTDYLYGDVVRWRLVQRDGAPAVTATVGALIVPRLLRLLRGRTLHGREFTVVGREQGLRFVPGVRSGWKADADVLTVRLSPALAEQMRSTLWAKRGAYEWDLKGFRLTVVPSEIKDSDGKVVRVEG